ncbi:MAG: DUF6498-containing protein [Candidatus Liptonbacteria bacterium]|nr:DUF6498-containing protein [Candidatus Liptonbacteria bacterium]
MENKSPKYLLADHSLWLLLFSNLITIFFAVKEEWGLSSVMWIYWFQSITIGIFNFVRILQLKDFSTERFEINGQPARPTRGTKISTAFFFLFHYGFFHFVYLVFLLIGSISSKFLGGGIDVADTLYILLIALLFFANHLFSFIYNKPRDTKKQNIGTLMFYPYARIIPMHLTIIFGLLIGKAALPFFLVLKTLADVIMHVTEHQDIRGGEEGQAEETT